MEQPDIDIQAERWEVVKGWPLYEISDHGRIRSWNPGNHSRRARSVRPKMLREGWRPNGYKTCALYERGRICRAYIHRLVAFAFVSGDTSLCVAHLDGDPSNNHYSNLKWVTHKENESHKVLHGTRRLGENSAKICDAAVRAMRRLNADGLGPTALAEYFGVSQSHVSNILAGKYRKGVGVWNE